MLDHATSNLLDRFGSANQALAQLADTDTHRLQPIRDHLHQAVTELQFHDMSTQLIVHTGKILQACAWKLADSAMEPEEDEIPLELEPDARSAQPRHAKRDGCGLHRPVLSPIQDRPIWPIET